MLEEHFFTCPYCAAQISMLLDLSAGHQSYIEDCEVCCNPIQILYSTEEDLIVRFAANRIEQ